MATVHFRIGCGDNPSQPCWVSLHDPEGHNRLTLGRNATPSVDPLADVGGHWIDGEGVWSAENGSFEVPMGDGVHRVRVLHGFGVPVQEHRLDIGARQLACRLRLDRPVEPPPSWLVGDLRVHGISPRVALLEAEAGGIGVVQLQAGCHWPLPGAPVRYHEALEFSGFAPALSSDGAIVAVNTLNRHPIAGAVSLLHAHRPIHPWGWGWDEPFPDWSLADWCAQCHRIKGVTIWPELEENLPEYEAIAALILGDIDGIELSSSLGNSVHDENNRIHWIYALADCGIFPVVVGASGKDSNRVRVGQKATWVDLGMPRGELTTASQILNAWMAGLKKGDCWASAGPWLSVRSGGDPATGTSHQAFTVQTLHAEGLILECVGSSGVLERWPLVGGKPLEPWDAVVPPSRCPWLAFRLVSTEGHLMAHGPAWPHAGGARSLFGSEWLQTRLHPGLAWAEAGGGGYFSPRIHAYLVKALRKIGS